MEHSQTGRASTAFSRLIEHYPLIDTPEGVAFLKSVVEHYPWFSLAHFALLRAERSNEEWQHLLTRLPYKPYPTIILEENSSIPFQPIEVYENDETDVVDSAIEYFSTLPPVQELVSQNIDSESIIEVDSIETANPEKELVTETLAQIYLTQGHKQKAIEIYLKLSLKNPEKSSYFANLINNITSQ